MSIAQNGLASEEVLALEDPPVSRAVPTQTERGRHSRVRRHEAYLVSVAAGVAAIGVCVASYLSDARRHAEQLPSPTAAER